MKGAALIECRALVLGTCRRCLRPVKPFVPCRRVASRCSVASALLKSQDMSARGYRGYSWAALAEEESPQGKEIGTLLVKELE